jgi:hypothetical protein
MTVTASRSAVALIMDYDLRHPDALEQARRHYRHWGVLYTDPHLVGEHCLVLVFRHAPDERWRPWESVRLGWILESEAA